MAAFAPYPFSPESTICGIPDLILRSSDSMEFYTQKALLGLVSPVFRDMFAFPAPMGTLVEGIDVRIGIPIVPVTEPSGALRQLLLLCFPPAVYNEQLKGIDGLYLAHAAADKYQLPTARAAIEDTFMNAAKTEPYRVYAIACHLGLKSLAMEAAWETLKDVYMPEGQKYTHPEFELIPAARMIELQSFHRQCGKRVREMVQGYQSLDANEAQALEDSDEGCPPWWAGKGHNDPCGPYSTDPERWWFQPAPWFNSLLDSAADAVVLRPAGETAASALLNYGPGTIRDIAICKLCSKDPAMHLTLFAKTLRNQVDLVTKDELNRWIRRVFGA